MQFSEKSSCLVGWTMLCGTTVGIFNMFHYIFYGYCWTKWQPSATHRQRSQMVELEFSEHPLPLESGLHGDISILHLSHTKRTPVPLRTRGNQLKNAHIRTHLTFICFRLHSFGNSLSCAISCLIWGVLTFLHSGDMMVFVVCQLD